ncbi:MAG: class I SAM-dependent methyltransferase [Myxococcales bacterium]|nr:class I SAM-dependent methyltransferase [Myxococcales bacterium]
MTRDHLSSEQARARRYYDRFSATYERHRHEGYHQLIDTLEVELAQDYCHGRVLEAGCGTGLILRRLAVGARQAVGIDLSSNMLGWARNRGLAVSQASVDALPFADAHFDAVVSFKVLAHVEPITQALHELARVTRAGGHLVLEFYNRHSLRHLIKRLRPTPHADSALRERDVFTRWDTLDDIRGYLPADVDLVAVHGVRVLTPIPAVHDIPLLRDAFASAERAAAAAPLLRGLGGFLVVVLRKR